MAVRRRAREQANTQSRPALGLSLARDRADVSKRHESAVATRESRLSLLTNNRNKQTQGKQVGIQQAAAGPRAFLAGLYRTQWPSACSLRVCSPSHQRDEEPGAAGIPR